MRILMVCIGNICRSPIAEGVMQHIANANNLNWFIDSAGTENYHIGAPPHIFSQKICQKHHIDISHQRARLFLPEDIAQFDKIFVMATDVLQSVKRILGHAYNSEKVSLFLNELHPGQNRSVTDPWYGSEEGYEDVFYQIEKTCFKILEHYR